MIRERSYSSAFFLERSSFQNIWKKKIWFFVQCKALINVNENMRKALDDGNMGFGVFVGLQIAFNTVGHHIL